MRIQIIILFVLLTSSSGWAQNKKPIPMPRIRTIGEGVVWRTSENKDEHGRFLPPWKEIRITNVFQFKTKPVVGEKVTVVPLDVNIASLDLRIVQTKKEEGCDTQSPAWWSVEFELMRQKVFFEIDPRPGRAEEFPFDVCVLYPAVRFARQVNRNRLTKKMLPKGIAIKTVKAAIDLTNDESPDVLIIDYCCGDPSKSAETCEDICGKTFRKNGTRWKLIDTSGPC